MAGKPKIKPQRYVLGDLHGAYKALEQVLRKSNFNDEIDSLYFLGDISDGYPEAPEAIERFLKIQNFFPVIGNHDLFLKEFSEGIINPRWADIGGCQTIIDFKGFDTSLLKKYFQKANYYYVVDETILCHGGFNHNKTITSQKKLNFCINRKLFELSQVYEKQKLRIKIKYDDHDTLKIKNVIIGHTPTKSKQPEKHSNVLNIDSGCGSTGRLTLMNFDNFKFVQSDLSSKLYKLKITTSDWVNAPSV